MGAPNAASPPPAAAASQRSAAGGGPAVVDAEGRPVTLGAREGAACAAKVCYGVLLYSSADVEARRGPRCWGVPVLREGVSPPPPPPSGAPASVSGPFRFTCTGKATVILGREGRPGAARHAHAVELPICEGLEVLASSKTEVTARQEAAADGRAPHAPPVPPQAPAAAQRSQHRAPPHKPPPGAVDLNTFSDRFQKAAGKIANRMAANAAAAASAFGGGSSPKR